MHTDLYRYESTSTTRWTQGQFTFDFIAFRSNYLSCYLFQVNNIATKIQIYGCLRQRITINLKKEVTLTSVINKYAR